MERALRVRRGGERLRREVEREILRLLRGVLLRREVVLSRERLLRRTLSGV